jgi:hypothetical protein
MIRFSEARWARVKHDAAAWWAGQLDRPLVQMRLGGADPRMPRPKLDRITLLTPYDLSVSAEDMVDCWDFDLASRVYLGDSFPCVWPNMGPGVLATALGADAGLTQLTRIAEQLGDASGIVAIAYGNAGDRDKAEAALTRFGVPLCGE